MLWFNDTSTLVGHFVLSPREREKRDRWHRRTGKKEEPEWKWRNRRNKNIPPQPLPATRIAGQGLQVSFRIWYDYMTSFLKVINLYISLDKFNRWQTNKVFLFFPENRLWHSMQIISKGCWHSMHIASKRKILYEFSKLIFREKKKIIKNVVCWKFYPGLKCSKLKMLLVNLLLKFWSLNMAYMLIFLLKKCEYLQKLLTFFFSKTHLLIRYCTY